MPPRIQREVEISKMRRRTWTEENEEMLALSTSKTTITPMICAGKTTHPHSLVHRHIFVTQQCPPYSLSHHIRPQESQCLALHNISREAKGVALSEKDSEMREAVVEEATYVYMLHRVLYPQVHNNGSKKKNRS
jgi:hypothetical protein